MNLSGYLVLGLILAVIIAVESKGRITCFRKIKRNGKCAGIIRKGYFDTHEECCEKGAGYALKKVKVGKNRFRCESCNEELLKPVRRAKPKKIHKANEAPPRKERKERKDRKERKKKEKKVTTTVPTEITVEPIVEIKSKEFLPSIRSKVSYSYIDPREEKVRWGPWSPCSVTCGAGWRSKFKVCDDCDRNDYENVQSQPCMVNFYCPVDGNWGPWFPWQPCSLSCDGGFRIRQRKCNYPPPAYGGLTCPGLGENNNTCNPHDCPVDGMWGTWSDFSLCSATCGQGVREKHRACNSPAPANGGKNCMGTSITTKKCQNTKCAQDGGWSMWGVWTPCGVTCGKGIRRRSRSCDSPRPMYGGKDCDGESSESNECFGGRKCPVRGGWSDWTTYGFCTAQRCDKGYQVRSRTCTQPVPRYGGRQCDGDQYERLECFNKQTCPRNGSWCEWSDWSKCTATCRSDTALRVRQRECKCPAFQNGGADCQGEGIAVRTCDELPPCKREGTLKRSDAQLDDEKETMDSEASGDFGDQEGGEEGGEEEDYPDHTETAGN